MKDSKQSVLYLWTGCQSRAVTANLWPLVIMLSPLNSVVFLCGSLHTPIPPSLSADIRNFISASQASANICDLCAVKVVFGVLVQVSHILMVVSADPDANIPPVGEYATTSTGAV